MNREWGGVSENAVHIRPQVKQRQVSVTAASRGRHSNNVTSRYRRANPLDQGQKPYARLFSKLSRHVSIHSSEIPDSQVGLIPTPY
jgi:hypothetical protein